MIKCGHCGRSHRSVAEVKACSAGRFTDADEREMQRMEMAADREESRRDAAAKAAKWEREADLNPATAEALHELRELLETKEIPEHERRYAKAVRDMLNRGNATGFAVRSAIARMEGWRNVRAGGYPGDRPWSGADRERAQYARATRNDKPIDQEGMYRLSRDVHLGGVVYPKGTLFQVTRSRESGRCSAKEIVGLDMAENKRPRLEYVRGMIFNILETELVPLEEAQEVARKTGWCVFGHFLTNPVSIARGMGPKCYERYPHLAKNAA